MKKLFDIYMSHVEQEADIIQPYLHSRIMKRVAQHERTPALFIKPALAIVTIFLIFFGWGMIHFFGKVYESQQPLQVHNTLKTPRPSIQIMKQNGKVVLKIYDGQEKFFLRKSSDPRKIKQSPPIPVKGNTFEDKPDQPIVFYLIEPNHS